jgi:hypothetical protein
MAVGGLLVLVTALVISARYRNSRSDVDASGSAPTASSKTYSELEGSDHFSSSTTVPRRERVALSTLYSSPPTVAALKDFVASVSLFPSDHSLLSSVLI